METTAEQVDIHGPRDVREYDPKIPEICAHGGELNQVWTNLIDNAIDALARRPFSGR